MSSEPIEVPDVDAPSAVLLAIRNAFTLGGALFGTWGIALGVRILIPRHLGPAAFGDLNFADAFTSLLFVTLDLGVNAYIRKEVSVRPSHASDFYGGALVIRCIQTAALFALMTLFLGGRSPEVRNLVYIYGFTQFFVTSNASLSAMLQSKGRVGGMSALSVITKVIWGVGCLAAMWFHAGLWLYGVSYLASESVETVALWWLAHQHLGLTFRVDVAETKRMLRGSIPYFVTVLTTTAYGNGKLDVTILDFKLGGREVGYYGVANTTAGLALLITPLIGWVLQPMLARAAARSREELYHHVYRCMELILTVAIPASLVINLGADVWLRLLFRAQYLPATDALRVLATVFVLTYIAMIYAITLVMLEKSWTLANISALALVVNAVLNLVFVRYSVGWFGEGGGGTGCALAMLGTELFVVTSMMVRIGQGAFDRRSARVIGLSLVAAAAAWVVHRLLVSIGPARLAADVAVYLAIVISTGALRPKEMIDTMLLALRNKKAAATE
ncbi:MAG TPA: flippase [Polyangiaceae bacterium]|nr:flippase [Polyangiaceae bacterium]